MVKFDSFSDGMFFLDWSNIGCGLFEQKPKSIATQAEIDINPYLWRFQVSQASSLTKDFTLETWPVRCLYHH
jgi:hypothetical protein